MAIQNKPTANAKELWCQLLIPQEQVGPLQQAFRDRKKAKQKPSRSRLVERRPRGIEDERLMLMIERIADVTGAKECQVVNELLWSAVNSRLRGS
jgi:hypothetical protein